MVNEPAKTSRVVLSLYAITVGIMLSGSVLALWRNWVDRTHAVEAKLVYDASMVSALIDSNVVGALRLLEITKRDLQQFDFVNAAEPQIHDLLHQSVAQFNFFNQEELFGLLFYMDKTGRIRAQDADGKLPDVNVSDRRYFKELARDPTARFSIGNLVTGRVSGTAVFHVAVPLLDSTGAFAGLLVQQIKTGDLAKIVGLTHDDTGSKLETFLPDGQITFTYPTPPPTASSSNNGQDNHVLSRVNGAPSPRSAILPPLSLDMSGSMIGYARSPNFELTTVAALPMSLLLAGFLQSQQYLLLYVLFAGLIVSVLYFVFYRKSMAFDLVQVRSIHDSLTGLHNRRGIDEKLPELMREAQRGSQPISVLFIDIDHFKEFNDMCGHEVGDGVLVSIARLIQNALQRPLDFVCRWGGEEFVAVLPETDERGATHVADRILEAVRSMPTDGAAKGMQQITVSIGLSSMTVNPSNINDDLIDQADRAMFDAKNSGRNCRMTYRASVDCEMSG